VKIVIEATDLPGSSCTGTAEIPAYDNIHVGVQRKGRAGELLDLHPADAASATWTLDCSTAAREDGIDVTGRYVQGRPGERFVYLSWGTVAGDGVFAMFRRAKLMMADVPPAVLAAAERSGILRARLGLTDPKGNPLCARVRPPAVTWSAESER
jgi:hypothetical protein